MKSENPTPQASITAKEYYCTYVPQSTINRAAQDLRTAFNFQFAYQYRLNRSETDPMSGTIEIAQRPFTNIITIKEIFAQRYLQEGFVLLDEDLNRPNIALQREADLIIADFMQAESSILIFVNRIQPEAETK